MQVTFGLTICDVDFYCIADVEITSPSTPYTYDEPGSPCEFKVAALSFHEDLPGERGLNLEIPKWLFAILADCGELDEAVQQAEIDYREERHD
jgi:hypothetical protein